MLILNLGSLNMDKVYNVDHFVLAGETILADKYEVFCGGKGLNQSIALARAGARVYHAGLVGTDGEPLCEALGQAGVDLKYLARTDGVSGHAVIQLTPQGQNGIVVYGGANGAVSREYIDTVLADFAAGNLLLLQNETSNVAYAMQTAKAKGMLVAFNPSPVTADLVTYPLDCVDYLILNEVEGNALAGGETNTEILNALHQKYPRAAVILTVGQQGVLYRDKDRQASHGVYDVEVLDTTGAGDTFCGYFLACIAEGMREREALEYASRASSLAVSRRGASTSIPYRDEVMHFTHRPLEQP